MAIGANLSQREQIQVSIAVVSLLLGAAYGYFLYLPQREQLAQVEQHIEALDVRNTQARATLARGNVKQLREEAAKFSADLVVLRQLVPTTNEVPALLENVSTAARRVGLDLASVEPMPVIAGEQFDTYRYKLSVTGGYHAIAEFLSNVGSLNRIVAPVAVDVKLLSTRERKVARLTRKGESLLDTDFQIQTYIARAPLPGADGSNDGGR